MNLLKETTETLERHDKRPADVQWVGTRDGVRSGSWDSFAEIASVIEYNNGYGGAEISYDRSGDGAEGLVVVGDGWWLERGEYDGSEWWEFKSPPVRRASLPLEPGHILQK